MRSVKHVISRWRLSTACRWSVVTRWSSRTLGGSGPTRWRSPSTRLSRWRLINMFSVTSVTSRAGAPIARRGAPRSPAPAALKSRQLIARRGRHRSPVPEAAAAAAAALWRCRQADDDVTNTTSTRLSWQAWRGLSIRSEYQGTPGCPWPVDAALDRLNSFTFSEHRVNTVGEALCSDLYRSRDTSGPGKAVRLGMCVCVSEQ